MKPDYRSIRIDETQYWSSDFLSMIGPDARIVVTYVFDSNSTTNCCELTPSYELHRAGIVYTTTRELTDDDRERIDEEICKADLDTDSDSYMHCSVVDRHKPERIRQFIDCDGDVTFADVVEYYQGNPW